MRRAGFLARLGGDEFGVLLEGVNEAKAASVVDLIRIQAAEDGDDSTGRFPLKLSAGWAKRRRRRPLTTRCGAPTRPCARRSAKDATVRGRRRTSAAAHCVLSFI